MGKTLEAGMNVTIPEGTFTIDTSKIPEDICLGKYPQVYPIIIQIMENSKVPTGNITSQTSNVIFKKREDKYEAEIVMQKIHMQHASLEQSEIFGLDSEDTKEAQE